MERFFMILFEFSNTIKKIPHNLIVEINESTYVSIFVLCFIVFLFFLLIALHTTSNILKRKKIENELNESKANLQKSLNFLRVVLDTIPNPIFCKNADGVYTDCNIEFEKYLGLKREEILNHTVYEIKQSDYAEIYHKADIQLMNAKGKKTYESKFKYTDGELHDILFKKATIISEKDEIDGLVGIMIDITDFKKNENKINRLLKTRESMLEINQSILGITNIHELFNLILEKAISIIDTAEYGSILILKEDGTLQIEAFKGYDPHKVKDFKIPLENSFHWIKTKGNIYNTVIINDIYNIEGIQIVDVTEKMKNWSINSSISTPIIINKKLYGMINIDSNNKNVFTEEDVQIMEYMKSQIEIALNKHNLYEQTIYLSKYDKLTNLYNRSYFDELFINGFQNIINDNNNFNLAVFDLNKLKYVNDTYGHIVGDEYIKIFAKELSNLKDPSNILARHGGDEFLAVFFNTDEQILTKKFKKMIKDLKNNPINFDGHSIVCSFSYGIANFPNDATSSNELIKIADKRMYEYKKQEKRQTCIAANHHNVN